ncbi:MAG: glycosyltransferase family 9 protein [Nitrospirae bacterium]|nr:glycosyltransferase family 9 protein [Nitrospirota bacterium]
MVKILLIQLDRFGDNLFIVPLIKGIKQIHPDSHVTVLAREEVKDILMGYKEVDSVMIADWLNLPGGMSGLDETEIILYGYRYLKNVIEGLRDIRFDRIINLNFNKITTLITSLLKVPDTVGFTTGSNGERIVNGSWANYMGCVVQTREYNPFHIIDVFRNYEYGSPVEDMSGFQTGDSADEFAMKLFHEEGLSDGTPVIALQPGASIRRRIWPKERFSELAGLLINSGIKVIVLGTNPERDITQTIKNDNPGVVDLTGKTTFSQLAAILKRCKLLVSNDTGTVHLSSAAGTRVIGLYICHAYPIETGPYGRGHITISPVIDCYPCMWKDECSIDYKCRHNISSGDVFSVINHALNPDNSINCNNKNIEVNISMFDDDGFISYVPLVKRPLTFNDILMLAYKRLWKDVLGNRKVGSVPVSEIQWLKETFDITDKDITGLPDTFDKKSDDLISALRVLECFAERGLIKAEETLSNIFSNEESYINTIQEKMEDIEIIDLLIYEKGSGTEHIRPLTTFYRMQKASIHEENPIQIIRETMEIYRLLKLLSSGMIIILNEITSAVFQRIGLVNV